MNELGRAEDAAFSMLESINKYYLARARLATKALKHPRVQDFVQSIIGAFLLHCTNPIIDLKSSLIVVEVDVCFGF